MVEVVRVDRETAPKLMGVNGEAKRGNTVKQHENVHEDIQRKKFDNAHKTDVHYKLSRGTSFSDIVSDEDWAKMFPKKN